MLFFLKIKMNNGNTAANKCFKCSLTCKLIFSLSFSCYAARQLGALVSDLRHQASFQKRVFVCAQSCSMVW